MSATQTTRRRRSTGKAAQDRAQREAKAAEAQESQAAPAEPEQPEASEPEQPEVADEGTTEEFELGSVVAVPAVSRSSSKASVWTDRLNDAAEKLEAAGYPEGQGVPVLICKTPRTAANTANNVRRKLKEGTLSGLLDGSFDLVTRGRTIIATFVPPAPAEEQEEAK